MKAGTTRGKGREGEEIAVEYLKENGYRIVEKNYRSLFGEIDLIAEKDGTIVFIEVKMRNTPYYGPPAAAIDMRKQRRLCRTALDYAFRRRLTDYPLRFDVVTIERDRIEVIRDAFEMQDSL